MPPAFQAGMELEYRVHDFVLSSSPTPAVCIAVVLRESVAIVAPLFLIFVVDRIFGARER